MANFTWNYWVLQLSGGAIGYEGSGSAVVERATGSDTATVTGIMKITSLGGDAVSWVMHLQIGSTEYTYTTDVGHVQNQEYTMQISQAVSVGSDAGTLDVKLWMTISGLESYPGGTSEVKSVTLEYGTKGASEITSVTNVNIGEKPAVSWYPLDASFKYRIRYKLGSWSQLTGMISPGSTALYTYNSYTLPVNADLLSKIPDSRTADMMVILYSYDSNGNLLGSSTKTFKVTVPASVVPTITSVTISGQDSTFNVYLVGYSKLTITCIAAGTYGSIPKTAVFAVGNKTYSAEFTQTNNQYVATVTTETLDIYGTIAVVTTVTDSRGLSAVSSQSITVYEYHAPQISDMRLNVSDSAASLTIRVTGSISPVNNLNDKYIRIRKTKISSSQTTNIKAKTALADYAIDETVTVTIADIETESYMITVTLYDSKYTSGVSAAAKTGIICVSRLAGGLGLAIFREATADDLGRIGIKGHVRLQGRATDDDPAGWLNAGNDGLFDYRDDGTQVFVLGRNTSSDGILNLHESTGLLRASVTGKGQNALWNADGKRTVLISSELSSSSKHGYVEVRDENGTRRAYMYAGNNGVFVSDGKATFGALNNLFKLKIVNLFSQEAISGDGYKIGQVSFTPDTGYSAIGIAGYTITTSDGVQFARYMNVFNLYLEASMTSIYYAMSNTGTNQRTVTMSAMVLQLKTSV